MGMRLTLPRSATVCQQYANGLQCCHLVRAPVPGSLDGESKDQARPGQVSRYGVPEDVEGVLARLVARRADASGDVGHGLHVFPLEVLVAPHLVEGWGGETTGDRAPEETSLWWQYIVDTWWTHGGHIVDT